MFNNVGAKALCDDIAHDLLVVTRCDRDDGDVRVECRVDEVTKLVEHAFRNGVGAVDHEQASWCTQFGEQHRERASKERFEFDRRIREVPQIDADCLGCVLIGGCGAEHKCALADA